MASRGPSSLPTSSRFIIAAVARISPQQAAAIWSPDLAVARKYGARKTWRNFSESTTVMARKTGNSRSCLAFSWPMCRAIR